MTLGSFLRFKSVGRVRTQLLSPHPPLGSLGGSNMNVAPSCFKSLSQDGASKSVAARGPLRACLLEKGMIRGDKDTVGTQLGSLTPGSYNLEG